MSSASGTPVRINTVCILRDARRKQAEKEMELHNSRDREIAAIGIAKIAKIIT